MFSCEYCEIFKNTFFIEYLRWLPMVKSKSLKSAKFQFQLFSTTLDIMGISSLRADIIAVKRDIHRKIFVATSIQIAIQTLKHLKQNQFAMICT